MTKQILDYDEVLKLLRQGLTQAKIAERFGVTQPTISAAIKRGRVKFETGATEKRLPWVVKKEHTNHAIPRLLRFALRLQEKDPTLAAHYRREAETFLRTLERTGTVIHYDADVPPHFFRVRRRPGIDTGLWRELDHG